MYAILIENLTKKYGDKEVLKQVRAREKIREFEVEVREVS
jgi:ABC-type histidine transport system ATPase subunit